jgi:hypothetical protein
MGAYLVSVSPAPVMDDKRRLYALNLKIYINSYNNITGKQWTSNLNTTPAKNKMK